MTAKLFLLVTGFSFLFCHCGSNNADDKNASNKDEVKTEATSTTEAKVEPYRYDLAKPSRTWSLPENLLEISGNTWVDNDHLMVIEDIHPNLYLLKLDKEATIKKTIPFQIINKDKFDIEDVAVDGTTAYALWSHGMIYKIENWNTTPKTTEWETGLNKKNNTEGLCFDPVSHNLLVACKEESGEAAEKKSARAIYMFDLAAGKMKETPFLMIEKKDFKEAEGEKIDFYPSAVAVHPVTHDVYVLSTKDTKGMAQYSYDGKLKNFQWIDKELMPQPEGICFSPQGTLYISTEGKHGEAPKLLEFGSQK